MKKFKQKLVMFVAVLVLTSCANFDSTGSTGNSINLTPERTKVVTARFISNQLPWQITNIFPKEGWIYSYATFTWDDSASTLEERKKHKVEKDIHTKWIDSNNVTVQDTIVHVPMVNSPQHVWVRAQANDIGVGSGHVEVYDGSKLLGKSDFEILNLTNPDYIKKHPYQDPPETPATQINILNQMHQNN